MLIIGHRGAPSIQHENTLPSFKAALAAKVDGLEFDVQYTKDNTLIIYHDLHSFKLNNQYIPITNFSFNELNKMNTKFIIPTLDNVLKHCPPNISIHIDIKSEDLNNYFIVEEIIQKLKKHKLEQNTIISSFNPFVLLALKQQAPTLKIGLLWTQSIGTPWFVTHYSYYQLRPYSFHASIKYINAKKAQWVRNHKMKLFLYTINNRAELTKAKELQADGIFTDHPNILNLNT